MLESHSNAIQKLCLFVLGGGSKCFMTDELYLKKCPVPQPRPSSIETRLLGGLDRAKALYVPKYILHYRHCI